MNLLYKELELFILTSNVSAATKERHQRNLSEFTHFLCKLKDVTVEEVHLEKIFTLADNTGKILKHNPINSKVIDHYFKSKQGLSYCQLLQIRNSLGAFFKYLEQQYQFLNPVRQMEFDIDELKPIKRPIKTMSRHAVLRFLHALVSTAVDYYRDLTLFSLLFSTGCRISEILKLRMQQINFAQGFITLEKTKSGKGQTVVLKNGLGIVLKHYCLHLNLTPCDYLFMDENERPLPYNKTRSLYKNYLKAAKLPETHLHSTRHSFATHLFENGSSMMVIQQLLRHSDMLTTVGYVHSNYVRNYGVKVSHNEKLYEKLANQLSFPE